MWSSCCAACKQMLCRYLLALLQQHLACHGASHLHEPCQAGQDAQAQQLCPVGSRTRGNAQHIQRREADFPLKLLW